MTVKELIDRQIFRVVNLGEELDREVTKVFCCDLLSIAMGGGQGKSQGAGRHRSGNGRAGV